MSSSLHSAILSFQVFQKRVAMTVGISMGMLLIIYFFTFAMLVDNGYDIFLKFELFSSIVFIIIYIFLNRISFALTRLVLKNKKNYKEILEFLKPDDINVKPEDILAKANLL